MMRILKLNLYTDPSQCHLTLRTAGDKPELTDGWAGSDGESDEEVNTQPSREPKLTVLLRDNMRDQSGT